MSNDIQGLLDTSCTVIRCQESLDQYKTPIDGGWVVVGEYPCRLTKANHSLAQGQPAAKVMNTYTLILDVDSDIKAGDLVQVSTIKYRCSEPYKPGGHHTEVMVTYEGEV